MRILRGILPFVAFLGLTTVASAQRITNVDANQEGKSIAVTYDLDEKANIKLFITQDGGRTKKQIPQEFLSGDIGNRVKPGTEKKILWRPLEQYPGKDYRENNVSFIVKGKPSMRWYALLNGTISTDSDFLAGFTIGQMGKVGWFFKGMTTFSLPQSADFESDRDGYLGDYPDQVLPAYSGKSSTFKAYAVAGVNVKVWRPLYVTVGLGYGGRTHNWETADGKWVRILHTVRPKSENVSEWRGETYRNTVIDLGLMLRFKKFVVHGGLTGIVEGYPDYFFGLGYAF